MNGELVALKGKRLRSRFKINYRRFISAVLSFFYRRIVLFCDWSFAIFSATRLDHQTYRGQR